MNSFNINFLVLKIIYLSIKKKNESKIFIVTIYNTMVNHYHIGYLFYNEFSKQDYSIT